MGLEWHSQLFSHWLCPILKSPSAANAMLAMTSSWPHGNSSLLKMHHFLKSSFPEILSGKPGIVFQPESQRGCSGGKCGCDDSYWGPISNNFPPSHTNSPSSCPQRFQGSQNGALQHPLLSLWLSLPIQARRSQNKQITIRHGSRMLVVWPHILHLIHYFPWHPTPVMSLLCPPSYLFNSVVLQMCSEDACILSHFSCIWLFVIPWTVAHQAPLSMEFTRQEYWSGLSWPPPGDLPNPGIEPTSLMSPVLQAGSLPLARSDLHQNQLRCLFQDFLNLLVCSPRMCFLNRLCEGILLLIQVWEWLSLT